MKKNICSVLGLAVLFGSLFTLGLTKEASSEVQVNINIVAPPPLQFAAPPDVYVVPSGRSYVYMVPDYDGVYFYSGNWYRFYNGHWFRSSHYNDRWDYIEMSHVPQVIVVLPPEYIHYVPSGYHRIHYDDYHRNWQTWDQRRHWDNYDWYQHEMSDDIRRERYNRIERDRQKQSGQSPQHQQEHQQKNVQSPQRQQEHQQKNVQSPQRQQEHQQKNVQSPQHKQEHQPKNVKKPQKQNSQKPQQHDEQKSQPQQGKKEHGGNT